MTLKYIGGNYLFFEDLCLVCRILSDTLLILVFHSCSFHHYYLVSLQHKSAGRLCFQVAPAGPHQFYYCTLSKKKKDNDKYFYMAFSPSDTGF